MAEGIIVLDFVTTSENYDLLADETILNYLAKNYNITQKQIDDSQFYAEVIIMVGTPTQIKLNNNTEYTNFINGKVWTAGKAIAIKHLFLKDKDVNGQVVFRKV